MRQYSTKQLLWCITLIAAGCATFFYAEKAVGLTARQGGQKITDEVAFLILYVSFTLAGVGVGVLFSRPIRGALLGGVCFIIFIIVGIVLTR
jgi:hypothetical protein